MKKPLLAAALVLFLGGGGLMAHHLTSPSPASTGCGVELWPKKTGSDVAAQSVNLARTTWASVHSLQAFPAPSPLTSTRVTPVETTVYRMTVTLVQFKLEADSDMHLVIQGSAGRSMIAEIPSPSCVAAASPFLPGIRTARNTLDAHVTPSGSWQALRTPIALTGVGFFDRNHGQAGVAPNAIELHPVLSIRFLSAIHASARRDDAPPFHDPPGGAD